jgi:hypothetical protein
MNPLKPWSLLSFMLLLSFPAEAHELLPLDRDMLFEPGVYEANQIFLSGEAHNFRENHELFLTMFKDLYEHAGVRVLVIEDQPSITDILMRYLQFGKDEDLDLLLDGVTGKNIAAGNVCYEPYLRNLRDFYTSLPEDDKFHVIALDIEQDRSLSKAYFERISLKLPSTQSDKLLNYLSSSGEAPELTQFSPYLDEFELFVLDLVMVNIHNNKEASQDDRTFFLKREEFIYQNFLKAAQYFGEMKIFGQWGAYHVFQDIVPGSVPYFLAYMLQYYDNSPFMGKTYSILYVYGDGSRAPASGTWNLQPFEEIPREIRLDMRSMGLKKALAKPPDMLEYGDYLLKPVPDYTQAVVYVRAGRPCGRLQR